MCSGVPEALQIDSARRIVTTTRFVVQARFTEHINGGELAIDRQAVLGQKLE